MRRAILLLGVLALALPAAARAQSLFGTAGLGLPVAPLDGRARALGGIGTGLLGENASLVNPADVAGLQRRSITAVFQPASQRISVSDQQDRRGATRFPLIRVVYPLGQRVVGSIGYGSFLDQAFAIRKDGTESLGGVDVPVHDILRSTGGLAQLRIGLAYSLADKVAVGVSGGLYTGEVQHHLLRAFEDSTASLQSFSSLNRWRYSGPIAGAGIRWDPAPMLRVAGSLTWSGELRARAEDLNDSDFRVSMPLQASLGTSALLAPELEATVGARWANWSVAAGDTPTWEGGDLQGTRNVWELGGGLEWQGIATATRTYPVRLGAHYAQLPFAVSGALAKEWSASVGVGARLAPSGAGPGALLDAALERGRRGTPDSAALSETFWRFTLSLSLFSR